MLKMKMIIRLEWMNSKNCSLMYFKKLLVIMRTGKFNMRGLNASKKY